MRDVALILVAWTSVAGCAAGSMMVRSPVQQECALHGLQRCPELVDGIVLYLDGDRVEARRKLKRASTRTRRSTRRSSGFGGDGPGRGC